MIDQRRILLTGASGLVGRRLIGDLEARGDEVIQLVRRRPEESFQYRWDPYAGRIDSQALEGLDAVVNLSGAGIGEERWTPNRKRVVRDSRTVTTRVLAEHLAALDDPPAVLISQSAIGIYGDRGDELLTEDSPLDPAGGFLSELTRDWEIAAEPAAEAAIRVVHTRTGLVLDRDAQLMKRLVPLYRAGLGGPIGHGCQWWSWISLDDVSAAITHLIGSDLEGPVNLVAPIPARQREFAHALGSAVHRPALLPTPRFGVELVLGTERAGSIALSSARVVPQRLVADGFAHTDSDLEGTVRSIV